MDLSDKVYIITGSYQGLGKVLSGDLESMGAKVIKIYHNNVVKDGYKCDITNEDEVKELFKYALNTYGEISGVVNCATLCIDNEYQDKSGEEFLKVVNTNLVGTYLIDKYSALNINNGVIVNIASTDGIDTYTSYSMDYSAAKAGVINLTYNFASTDKNNKYLCLAPVWIDTEEVLKMDPKYLKEEMSKHNQNNLLKKEDVSKKIINMLTDENYKSGSLIRLDDINE